MQDLITVYRMLAERSDYALHLGLTEAGMGSKGIVASSAALGILLQEGIGDTIRISLTPEPGGDRTQEVRVAQELLQTMGFRIFAPQVAACPGCGRTTSTVFQELARDIQAHLVASMPEWRARYPGVERLNVAVMGCIVNGPGESKHADIGISLPGTGETPGRAGVRRRRQDRDSARAAHRRGIQGAGRGLCRAGGSAASSGRRSSAAMYEPPLHREDDLVRQHALIRARPLGLLVSHGPQGLIANAVPFRLDRGRLEVRRRLQAHVARANPQWRDLAVSNGGARRVPGRRPLRLALVVRDQARDAQGRADLELCHGPGARTGPGDRGRRMARAPDRGADGEQEAARASALGRVATRRRTSSRSSARRSSASRSRSPISGENGRRARTATRPTAPGSSTGLEALGDEEALAMAAIVRETGGG